MPGRGPGVIIGFGYRADANNQLELVTASIES
jgi:hypothetical protein